MNGLSVIWSELHGLIELPVWAVMLLKITTILFFAWGLHLALVRFNPRWRVLLWRITAVGLVLLPGATWLLPELNIPVMQPAATAIATAAAVGNSAQSERYLGEKDRNSQMAEYRSVLHDSLIFNNFSSAEAVGNSVAVADDAAETTSDWPVLLMGVWLGGIVTLLLRLCIGQYLIHRLIGSTLPAPRWIGRECELVAAAVNCRHQVEVVQSSEASAPLLCGLRRTLLLLPERMCTSAYREDLPGILAHELTHARSRDVFWNLVLQLISTPLWFHPLAWRARLVHLAACELVCDATSAHFVGDVAMYCRTLARVAIETCRPLPSSAIPMARTSQVGRRLDALKRKVFHAPLGRRGILAFGLVGLLTIAVIGSMRLAIAEAEAVEATLKKTEENSEKEITSEPQKQQNQLAMEIVQKVYDNQAWLDSAKSFFMRWDYKVSHKRNIEAHNREGNQPISVGGGMSGLDELDTSTFFIRGEWAWDESRIRNYTQSHYEKSNTTIFQTTKIWNGLLAVECSQTPDGKQYVIADKLKYVFNERVTRIMEIPWWPDGIHNLWWAPNDVDKQRDWSFLSPKDFELAGKQEVGGRLCHVVVSKAGHCRMYISVEDGRLYRRMFFMPREGKNDYNPLAIRQNIGGAAIKTLKDWAGWLEKRDPVEQRRISRDLAIAEFAFAQPVYDLEFDDYRQVSKGCWMPFSLKMETILGPYISHIEQTVTEAFANKSLPDKLFRIELKEGARIAADWRYNPPISYTYSKEQSAKDRIALSEATRVEKKKSQEKMEKRRELFESRMGQEPPLLPKSVWLNGKPLSWNELLGKVVVIHFWDEKNRLCDSDLPLLSRWHDNSATNNIAVIGIHIPTDNIEAVRKKLAEFNARYPVLIDSPAIESGGFGLMHDWFGNSRWPNAVLVNKKGLIAGSGFIKIGDIEEQVKRLLGEDSQQKENADR